MLTQNEKWWLKERTKFPVFSCSYCAEGRPILEKHCSCIDVYPCVAENLVSTKDDVLEAAEFERRVVAKLENVFQHINDYWINLPCDACPQERKCDMDCNDSILKWARLQVEEEMDNGT